MRLSTSFTCSYIFDAIAPARIKGMQGYAALQFVLYSDYDVYFTKCSDLIHNITIMTVLESGSVGNASSSDEELEQWEQIFMMRDENGNSYHDKRKKRSIWCRPSCIPVSIVILLIVLVVLVPLLDQPNIAQVLPTARDLHCSDECRLSLVESIPEGHMYPPNSTHANTKNVWLDLIDDAQSSIEIASLYWTLRFNEQYPYNSSIEGEQVFQALLAAGLKRNIKLRIAQNWPSKSYPNVDTEYLVKKKAAQVRSLNFSKLLGSGVLHTKFWIIDKTHFYIGSANMDWRSLTQADKKMGRYKGCGSNLDSHRSRILKKFRASTKAEQ
ncbi:unnamed protein product [Pieris macdunnoughi]|uniref:PLD phosphodiesterase domain-containing protein n=1 Tax=Pieris macdunnoughi TaxID=345717 RepID=A0A821S1A5_9NEOP|nr:unnamed protein product [Pieris macdunnoughi]